jgi:hypothetical protein
MSAAVRGSQVEPRRSAALPTFAPDFYTDPSVELSGRSDAVRSTEVLHDGAQRHEIWASHRLRREAVMTTDARNRPTTRANPVYRPYPDLSSGTMRSGYLGRELSEVFH